MSIEILGHGWELLVQRIGLQNKPGEPTRTYSSYQVFIDGIPVGRLDGHMCERTGPGDNSRHGVQNHLRVREGRYPLSTQFGDRYRSANFSAGPEHPMPGFLLLDTGERTAILVHPGHPPRLYISAIGCLNRTRPRTHDQDIDFLDSRGRVIEMIDSLKTHDPSAFAHRMIGRNTPIAGALAVISGEPMGPA
jgi:hypothetical protein